MPPVTPKPSTNTNCLPSGVHDNQKNPATCWVSRVLCWPVATSNSSMLGCTKLTYVKMALVGNHTGSLLCAAAPTAVSTERATGIWRGGSAPLGAGSAPTTSRSESTNAVNGGSACTKESQFPSGDHPSPPTAHPMPPGVVRVKSEKTTDAAPVGDLLATNEVMRGTVDRASMASIPGILVTPAMCSVGIGPTDRLVSQPVLSSARQASTLTAIADLGLASSEATPARFETIADTSVTSRNHFNRRCTHSHCSHSSGAPLRASAS